MLFSADMAIANADTDTDTDADDLNYLEEALRWRHAPVDAVGIGLTTHVQSCTGLSIGRIVLNWSC